MGNFAHLFTLLAGLSLAAQASGLDEFPQPVVQKCPELRGRYSCHGPFMLSYRKKRGHEMKVVQSERDGFSIYLFEAGDGADGFWAVGDSFPHAYESEIMQAWGFKEIDTEANCPKPESLEIRFMVERPGKPRLSSVRGSKKPALPSSTSTSGMLTFVQKRQDLVQVTA